MKTLADELARARRDLIHYEDMLGHALDRQPRDRHFTGEKESDLVIEYADKVEIADARVRDLERRIRLAERVAA